MHKELLDGASRRPRSTQQWVKLQEKFPRSVLFVEIWEMRSRQAQWGWLGIGKCIPGRRNSVCKGQEARESVAVSRTTSSSDNSLWASCNKPPLVGAYTSGRLSTKSVASAFPPALWNRRTEWHKVWSKHSF